MGDVRYPGCGMCSTVPATSLSAMRRTRDAAARRTFGLIAVLAAIVLFAAACTGGAEGPGIAGAGSSSASSSGGSSATGSASDRGLAYSECMRNHGIAKFPDPGSDGSIPKLSPQQLGVGESSVRTAQQACSHLLQASDAQVQQILSGMRDFARCMRHHGVPNWPDPSADSDGQPVFDLRGQIAPDSQRIATKSDQCAHLLTLVAGQGRGVVLCNGEAEEGCHHYG